MAAMVRREENRMNENQQFAKLFSSYLGLGFTFFLGSLPENSVTFVSTVLEENKDLTFEFMQAEEQLKQLHTRRKEDSKANARVVEIFASHRHAWQEEEKRLLLQIDEANEEIAYLKGILEGFEKTKAELEADIHDLKRGVRERDEMLNFVSRSDFKVEGSGRECYSDIELTYEKPGMPEEVEGCFMGGVDEMGAVYGQSNRGFGPDFLNSTASKFWSEKATSWQDIQCDSLDSVYGLKHFVARRDFPWKIDADSTGVSSKLKLLEQELLNLERLGKADLLKLPAQMRKQAKRYQSLGAKIDDLCRKMQASDPCDPTISPEFRIQRQTEFLLEAFRLQQKASETNQKLMLIQTETWHGETKLATYRAMGSIRNNFTEIQRNLEIWLARIIGDLEGILSRDGASRVREFYISRYPFIK